MEWLPTLSVDVEKVATPLPFRVPEPIADAPSLKATLPDGVPAELVTVAVKVTGLPKADGLAEDVRAVAVGDRPAPETAWLSAEDVLVMKQIASASCAE